MWDAQVACISMTGSSSTSDPSIREAILKALCADSCFKPEWFSSDDRKKPKFDLASAVKGASGRAVGSGAFLGRTSPVSYEAVFGERVRRLLEILATPKDLEDAGKWEQFFVLGDSIAEAIAPDIGFVHVTTKHDVRQGAHDPEIRWKTLMDEGTLIPSATYFRDGAGGLGFRTYLGPFVLEQIGIDRVRSLPAPCTVTDMSYGGVRVDLAPQPWNQQWAELRDSWRAAMAHLAPSRWFCEMTVDATGAVTRRPPTHEGWSPGGQAR